MIAKETYINWLAEFFAQKSNELEYSQRAQPKRNQKLVLDLSVAQTQPLEIFVPFKTLIVSRVYSTASPTTQKDGNVKIMFDEAHIANVDNALPLFVNDTLRSGTLIRKAFLTWTAQTDTSMEISFFPDIEIIAGTSKTAIVGTVSVQNTNATSMYNKPPIPDSVTTYRATVNNANVATVPANKYWIVNYQIYVRAGGATGGISVGGTILIDLPVATAVGGAETVLSGRFMMKATQVLATVNCTGSMNAGFSVEEYSI